MRSGATAPRSLSTGVIWSDSDPSRTIVGRSSRRKPGSFWMFCASAVSSDAAAVATVLAFCDEVRGARPVARERGHDLVRVAREVLEHAVLVAEDREDLVGLLQRRVGVADRLAQLRPAARDGGAELVEDDRQPLLLGQPHDVRDQVEVDRLARSASTGSRYWPSPSPRGMRGSGGGAGVPSGRGWVGVHSTNFSPISDCGRIVHSASRRKSLKPARSMRRTTAAFWSRRHVERVHLADLDARRP